MKPIPDSKTTAHRAKPGEGWGETYRSVRQATRALAAPLSAEDCAIQSMPDASPVKWHLAHTTWFFETFVLAPHKPDYRPFNPAYRVLFNSYYNSRGRQAPAPGAGHAVTPRARGNHRVSRSRRRRHARLARSEAPAAEIASLIELGLITSSSIRSSSSPT